MHLKLLKFFLWAVPPMCSWNQLSQTHLCKNRGRNKQTCWESLHGLKVWPFTGWRKRRWSTVWQTSSRPSPPSCYSTCYSLVNNTMQLAGPRNAAQTLNREKQKLFLFNKKPQSAKSPGQSNDWTVNSWTFLIPWITLSALNVSSWHQLQSCRQTSWTHLEITFFKYQLYIGFWTRIKNMDWCII